MKKTFSIICMLVANFFFVGCEKTEDELLEQCFKVKILDDVCGSAVVQIQDEAFKKFGINGYQLEGISYDHVFFTEFSCADLAKLQTLAARLRGLVINVKIQKKLQVDTSCGRCTAVLPNAPDKLIPVILSQNCN